uniref:CCHC-type domain-containing protein n=1 Tax=Leptocylindrus danicus TaxID=163516 RepID=A0A7S2NTI7_9STRA|mmetsp:Transcript_13150/g.19658  ORF Transcript_13150/g.19658 Transcript_13150/m.19658 type:complete len:437 (+) Transcript_13150:89-1399(+)
MPTTNSASTNARRNATGAVSSAARSNNSINENPTLVPTFKGQDPNLPTVILGGDKLQGTVLVALMPQRAGQFDNNYNGNIEKALQLGKDITIKATSQAKITADFNKNFYPGGVPDKSTDADGHTIYMASLQNQSNQSRKDFNERKRHYKTNKERIRNIALGQCEEGIKSLIKQHADYDANKSDVFWIMKQIMAASRERGRSAHILYPHLVDLYQELFKNYQNQKSLNNYYREFMELVNMVKDRGALIKIDEAAEWEAKKDPNITKTSTEAYELGFEALMAELFIRNANEVDFGDWRTNNKRLASSGNSYSVAKTVNSAYQQMVEVLQETKKNADSPGSPRAPRTTAQFAQVSNNGGGGSNNGGGGSSRNGARGSNGRPNYGARTCHRCGSTEHLVDECPIPASAVAANCGTAANSGGNGGNSGNVNSNRSGTTDNP